ncbi:MAG TPA: PAS domain S-box protein [Gammaproteobacteria bacterium]
MPLSEQVVGPPSPATPAHAVPDMPVLDMLPAAAYTCGADGLITGYNQRAAELWGRSPRLNDPADRFCGSGTLLAPDGTPLAHADSPMAIALREGRACEGLEAIVVRPDMTRRIVLYYVTPVRGAGDVVNGATAVMVDVTEREEIQRAARAALQDSEANFRGFFDNVAVGAVQVNAEGRFVKVNDRYCEITGYSREELLTMSPFDLDHPDERDADVEIVLAALADPAGMYHKEKRYVRKDGTVRWVHVAANFLRDPLGRPVQTAAIVLDISERKWAEQALQEADRLKDDFLATLSHELRNPLAPLKNAAELLRHSYGGADEWCRDVIDRQVRHLERLIDDLLDLSRITRDKLELRKERILLADVIHAAVEASRPMLERCEQALTVSLPYEPVPLHGDIVRLTQVFTNLLTNAAKFTDRPGAVRLAAACESNVVTISVADDGIGITSEEIGRVFDKFYQSPRRGKRFLGGLGIGLSLVRRLVELHGGSVEARSGGIAAGSKFIVRLPIALPQSAAVKPSEREGAAGRAKRVMIVDDNVDGADSLARLLALMGHETVTEYDGPSALRRAQQFAADVIFLDLGMPIMDGFEVCRRLRAENMGKRPTIVALTGWGRREDVARAEQVGFDAHLVKPVDRAALAHVLESAPAAVEKGAAA